MVTGRVHVYPPNPKRAQPAVYYTLVWLVCMLAAGPGMAQRDAQTQGTLQMDGDSVTRLVLESREHGIRRFDTAEGDLRLPAGTYRVKEIHLGDAYRSVRSDASSLGLVEVNENETTALKAGAPLRHRIRTRRRGRCLVLNYELLGQGGEKYADTNRESPPRFMVRKGDREIASGQFEYG